MNKKGLEREYPIAGIIALIIILVIGIIFFTNYQVYFEDVKQITEEVFQWSTIKHQNIATQVATGAVKADIDVCQNEAESGCYCLLSKTNLPKDSVIRITNNDKGSTISAMGGESEILDRHEWGENFHVGVVERRLNTLVCTIPEYPITIKSVKSNKWSLTEHKPGADETSYPVYEFLEEPIESFAVGGVDAASDEAELEKMEAMLPGLYKHDDKTVCLVTEKFIKKDDSSNEGHIIGNPLKLTDLEPLDVSGAGWRARAKFWLWDRIFGTKDTRLYSAIDFIDTSGPCSPMHAMPHCPRPVPDLKKDEFKVMIDGFMAQQTGLLHDVCTEFISRYAQLPKMLKWGLAGPFQGTVATCKWRDVLNKDVDEGNARARAELVYKKAEENKLDPFFLFSVIMVSSGFNTNIVSPDKKRAGVMYLTESQVNELVAAGHSLPAGRSCCDVGDTSKDPRYDDEWAIEGGAILLKKSKDDLLAFKYSICSIEEVSAAFMTSPSDVILADGLPDDNDVLAFVERVCYIYHKMGGRECREVKAGPLGGPGEGIPGGIEGTTGNYVIFIDPGHGWGDSGPCSNSCRKKVKREDKWVWITVQNCVKDGLCEKDVNMKQSRLLKNELEKYGGVTVYMTRGEGAGEGIFDSTQPLKPQLKPYGWSVSSKKTVSLKNRRELAKMKGADILVSMHNNCIPDCSRLVIYPYNDKGGSYNCGNQRCEKGKELATAVRKYMEDATGEKYPPRTHKGSDRYGILRGEMPSVIIEHASTANPDLRDGAKLNAMAKAAAEAIIEYGVDEGFLKRTATGTEAAHPVGEEELEGEEETQEPAAAEEITERPPTDKDTALSGTGGDKIFINYRNDFLSNGDTITSVKGQPLRLAFYAIREGNTYWNLEKSPFDARLEIEYGPLGSEAFDEVTKYTKKVLKADSVEKGGEICVANYILPQEKRLEGCINIEVSPPGKTETPTTTGYYDMAIVLDDGGEKSTDNAMIDQLVAAGAPKITIAIFPERGRTTSTANYLASKYPAPNFDIIIHQPMQYGEQSDPACQTEDARICNADSKAEAKAILSKHAGDFKGFTNFAGFNNHQGSLVTQNRDLMEALAEVAKSEGMIFLDSKIYSGAPVAYNVMSDAGVRAYLRRGDFLDNTGTKEYTLNALKTVENVALSRGYAAGIGHITRPTTIDAIGEYLKGFTKENGFYVKQEGDKKIRLVRLSELPE